MKLTRIELAQGAKLPPFYYGRSHMNWMNDTISFYPIPINYIIRFCIAVRYYWDNLRCKPSMIDQKVLQGVLRHMRDFNKLTDKLLSEEDVRGAMRNITNEFKPT